MHPEIKKRYGLFAIIILLVGVVAYFALVAHAPVETEIGPSTEVKTPVENPAVNTGTAIKTDKWYPVDNLNPVDFELKEYGTTVRVTVSQLGGAGAELVDQNLFKADKLLQVNMRYRVKNSDKVYETGIIPAGFGEGGGIGGWKELIGDVDYTSIEWQPEFWIKNRNGPQQPQKVSI